MHLPFLKLSAKKSRARRRLRSSTHTFETLESRRLLAATDLRFVTYNTLNFDSSSGSRQDEMAIVFAELDADVIAVQEIHDTAGANFLLNALNANGNEYARSSFLDGPGTDQMLFYRTSKVSLVSQNNISTSLRSIGEFTLNVADTLFNVYNFHLKASPGEDNEQQRLDEVTTLREHLETIPADREFIVAGDANIRGSSEDAYQKLTQSESNNDGRVEDLLPPNLIGEWHNNSSFSSVHTQSPRTASFGGGSNGGLDDRFDVIFSSFGLNDEVGLEYVEGSQFVLGNDGQHFNQSILAGSNSSASREVLEALHDGSDHLPVVAEFVVNSPIGVTVTQTGGSTSVTEDGQSDTYELVLDSVPDANVTIQVTPDGQLDLGNGAAVPLSLTFTPANALVAQSVTVSAVDDADVEGVHTGSISHVVTSSDADFDGLAVDSVDVTISDNDGDESSFALLNELYVNNPGADSNFEYVEIIAEPSSTLSDIWLLEIEGDGNAAGTVDNAQNLSSFVAGSNGLLALGVNYETSTPWGDELDPETALGNLEGETIENGSLSFLLVRGFTGSVGADLDTNNDGVLDSTPWTVVLDDAGWSDGGGADHVYANAVLGQTGPPDAATRIFGDNQSSSSSSWFDGAITGTVTYESGSSNLPADAVITPGSYNFGATAPSVDELEINAGIEQRSTVDSIELVFDGAVEIDPDAFVVTQRTDGDGTATGAAVTVNFDETNIGDDTFVTITFDGLIRSGTTALEDGNYQLTIDGSKVRRPGTNLTLGADVVFGDSEDDNFYSLFGDATGNRLVDVRDLLEFRRAYLAESGDSNFDASVDFDGSGLIDVRDLLQFRRNYLETLNFG